MNKGKKILIKNQLNPENNGIYEVDKVWSEETYDMVNHPQHYTNSDAKCAACNHPIECIDITRHMSFNIGNAMKYLWRHAHKNGIEDLKKARWYLDDQIKTWEALDKLKNGEYK